MKRWPCLLLLALLPRPGEAQVVRGEDLPVVERVLDNGMRFLILKREGAPIVSFVTHFGVGSVNEVLGYTGIAHLLEHMLFKGTTTVGARDLDAELALLPVIDAVEDSIQAERALRRDRGRAGTVGDRSAGAPDGLATLQARLKALEDSARGLVVSNEFDRILTRNGARGLNASTSAEATHYYVQLPSNRAELWFALEADRMRNPVFREFYTERDVVAEERRMRVDNDPGGQLYEALLAAAYRVHPYGVPTIGHMSDILSFTRRQVEEYYHRYYGPGNATVAVVGDVEPDTVVAWAERYFGPIPRGEAPRRVMAEEPPQRGERRVEVVFDAEPRMVAGWHVVDELHDDMPAITILSAVLAGGPTSRLYRRLVVEQRLAQSVSTGRVPGSRDPQLFIVSASPLAPNTTADLERAIYREIERLQEEPPAADELERILNQYEAGEVRRLRSNFGLAFQLAESSAVFGDWRTTFGTVARLRAVTPADVQRVARRYLTPENRTVAVLRRGSPLAEDPADAAGSPPGRGAASGAERAPAEVAP